MRDKSRNRNTRDIRIDVGQAHEVGYWTGKWGCTVQQLRDTVKAVGPMMRDVQRKLGMDRGLVRRGFE